MGEEGEKGQRRLATLPSRRQERQPHLTALPSPAAGAAAPLLGSSHKTGAQIEPPFAL